MKLLFAIPHFFGHSPGAIYASMQGDRRARAEALARTVSALHRLFGGQQYVAHWSRPETSTANECSTAQVDVVICTTGGQHVLDELPIPGELYTHVSTECEPKLLGCECHAVLRDRLSDHDYYAFLEDDLVLHDPWFFAKLRHFTEQTGPEALLQPNRYELSRGTPVRKVYVDGDLDASVTSAFQDVHDRPEVSLTFLDVSVMCRRPLNPHAGSFFLNAEQMDHWAKQPYFLDRDCSFVAPMASAATLGVMRTFRVYKPAPPVANFLEVEHFSKSQIERHARVKARSQAGPQRPMPKPAVGSRRGEEDGANLSEMPVQALWIGEGLSTMERLSIASFVATGHEFHLYVYRDFDDVPDGATVLDANEILPESEIFVYRQGVGKGSYAAFSDVFRFKLLLEKGGWWVDLDVVALRRFAFDRAYVFGYERTGSIGSAIVGAPQGSALMRQCYEEARSRGDDIEWGEIGPKLLTRMVLEHELVWAAEPSVVFHPVGWQSCHQIIEPGGKLSRQSYAVHLIRHVWLWGNQDPDATYPFDCIYEKLKRRYLNLPQRK